MKKTLSLLLCLLLALSLFAGCQKEQTPPPSGEDQQADSVLQVSGTTEPAAPETLPSEPASAPPTEPAPTDSASSHQRPDNGLDADAILADARNSMDALDSYAVTIDLPAKLRQTSYGVNITVTCDFRTDMELVKSPRAARLAVSVDMGRFGGKQETEGFLIEEDGVVNVYYLDPETGGYVRVQSPEEELTDLLQQDFVGELDCDWEVEETEDAYLLSSVLSTEQTQTLLGFSGLMIGDTDAEEKLGEIELEPVTLHMTVDKQTKRLLTATADVTSLLSVLLTAQNSGITASSGVLTVRFSRFDEIEPITPPEDWVDGTEPPV